VAGVWIYPADVLCPMDHTNGNKVTITDRSFSIHLYDCSWLDHKTMRWRLHLLKNWMIRTFGAEKVGRLVKLVKKK
jgi:hypothetical protein